MEEALNKKVRQIINFPVIIIDIPSKYKFYKLNYDSA